MSDMKTLGFMGFGEAAYHMAAGLTGEGLTGTRVFDPVLIGDAASPAHATASKRAGEAGVTVADTPEALAGACDTVILAVPASFARNAADEILVHMGGGQMLVDVCSSSPGLKEEIAADCAARGVLYVDSPMLGPLPLYGHRVPIAASGAGAREWHDAGRRWNMAINVIDGPAGMASRIKLSRSIFTKGLEALLVETFQFARKNGVEDIVMSSIGATMDETSFPDTVRRYVAGDLLHAARRARELEDAIAIMIESGIAPHVATGALRRLEASSDLGAAEALGGEMPGSLDEVYAIWRRTGAI